MNSGRNDRARALRKSRTPPPMARGEQEATGLARKHRGSAKEPRTDSSASWLKVQKSPDGRDDPGVGCPGSACGRRISWSGFAALRRAETATLAHYRIRFPAGTLRASAMATFRSQRSIRARTARGIRRTDCARGPVGVRRPAPCGWRVPDGRIGGRSDAALLALLFGSGVAAVGAGRGCRVRSEAHEAGHYSSSRVMASAITSARLRSPWLAEIRRLATSSERTSRQRASTSLSSRRKRRTASACIRFAGCQLVLSRRRTVDRGGPILGSRGRCCRVLGPVWTTPCSGIAPAWPWRHRHLPRRVRSPRRSPPAPRRRASLQESAPVIEVPVEPALGNAERFRQCLDADRVWTPDAERSKALLINYFVGFEVALPSPTPLDTFRGGSRRAEVDIAQSVLYRIDT